MLNPSWIELSRSALQNNVTFLEELIGPQARFTSVIKGNAYGHDIDVFVPLAEQCGVRHFAVFSPDEAERVLRVRTQDSDVMIMGPLIDDATEWAVAQGVSFWTFEVGTLDRALVAAKALGQPARVHLELETGMNRTGLAGNALQAAVDRILAHPDEIQVEGVCTHFAGAENVANYLRIQQQIVRFEEGLTWLREQGVTGGLRHCACSAAAFTYPRTRLDLVRFGISQYGFWSSKQTQMNYLMKQVEREKEHERAAEQARVQRGEAATPADTDRPISRLPLARTRPDPLRRVLSWKSRVMSVKRVGPGEFLGYGTSYLTEREQLVAAVPVGYALGYSRALSNLGRVLIHGERMGVVGRVNMSMLLVDVTELPAVEVGDEVVLIGSQGDHTITVASFSDAAGDLSYEMLVKLDVRIPRIVVD